MVYKKLQLFILVFLAVPLLWSAELPTNLSSIVYEKDDSIKNNLWIYGKCTGTIESETNLQDAGISDQELKEGIGCAVGDFDGNGYVDFCLYGKVGPKKDTSFTQFFKVIYFDKKKILKTELIQHPRHAIMSLYPPRNEEGKWGEPVTKNDGLVDWGEGARNIFYVYDQKMKSLNMSEHVSENH